MLCAACTPAWPRSGADDELASLLFEAGGKLGWKHVEDVNDSDDERIGYSASTIRHGLRTSAASAFLRPVLEAGVALETGVRAERILISGGRAVGVAGRRGATAVTFHARKEVFVACGAVESPLLLERSGIGRPDLLHRLGIELQVSSPNVGERVIEHRVVAVQVRFGRKLGAAEDFYRLLQNGDLGASFEPATDGVLSAAGLDFVFHAKSEPGLARPDLSAVAAPYPIDPTAAGYRPANYSGMTIGMFQSRPETTSTIHSSAPGPDAPPTITARYLETETDQRAAGRILGRLRELLGTSPLAEVIEGEDYPTEAVASDPESGLAYARNYGAPGYHAVGSCAMGPTADDVLDAELRVRGVDGLRVVDASAFPFQVSANVGAPVMALAWLAADLVD